MIYSRRIHRTLMFLDREYQKHISSFDQERPIMFAKLAIFEYCGWIEASMDEIAINCVRKRLRTSKSRSLLNIKINATHGFVYKEKARPLLAHAIGTERLLIVEKELSENGRLQTLTSNLATMNTARREAAHTFTNGITSRFDAPSITIQNFNQTEPILRQLWSLVASHWYALSHGDVLRLFLFSLSWHSPPSTAQLCGKCAAR